MTKRAISFGINYYDTPFQLRGCINDTLLIKKTLIKYFGYSKQNITIITDNRKNKIKPTKEVILSTLKNFIKKTKKGDTLFVHYSGHGSHIRDSRYSKGGKDELDNQDEVICPCDDTYITDDDLNDILVDRLVEGAKLICVFDCCHSGSVLDLPIRYNHKSQIIKENNSLRFTNKLDCVMISGCLDVQTSADAYINGYKGALTWAFTETLRNLANSKSSSPQEWTWKDFISIVRFKLRNKRFEQIPQLSVTDIKILDSKVQL